MEIYRLTHPIEERNYPASIIAIGFFDGVHLGHQQVIKKACKIAKDNNLLCGVMTFDPHPKEVMGIKNKIDQITPIESKLNVFKEMGLDLAYLVNFTKEFASISPNDFIEDFLLKLNIKGVVVGFDFTFGYKGLGTPQTLKENKVNRFTVDVIEPFIDNGEKVSSTRVRKNLLNGKISEVKRLLGRNYTIFGKVVHGYKRGRTIGFPTANIELVEDYLNIKNGVYVVKVHHKKKTYAGVMNVGFKPTFDEKENVPTYEVYIIDFHGSIYNEILKVEIIDYIRNEIKFNSIEELTNQINKDVEYTKQMMIKMTR